MSFRFLSFVFIFIIFFGFISTSRAQNYKPRTVYDSKATELTNELRELMRKELNRYGRWITRDEIVEKAYRERTDRLIRYINGGLVIKDDTIQQFVDGVFHNLLSANQLSCKPERVLVLKSPIVNAYCNGDGVFVLTVGLLGAIRNESQLAFILAHEIAHYELDHVRYRTLDIAQSKFVSKAKESSKKIMTSKDDATTFGEMDSLRRMVYDLYGATRQQETQADSMGLVYMRNAGYSESHCPSALSSLNPEFSKYRLGAQLFDALHFSKYPFQSYWLNPPASVYTKKRDHLFIFSSDSLHSHPEIEHRNTLLEKNFTGSRGIVNRQDSLFVNQVIRFCEFETIESCSKGQYLDLGLLHSLQLKVIYPRNDYVNSRIAQVFIDLYRHTDENSKVLPKFVAYYGEELQAINAFLNNLRLEEIGEMAFHFMNNQGNFNPSCEEHYYILWQICDMTKRNSVKEKVLQNYITRFGKKGAYYNKMN